MAHVNPRSHGRTAFSEFATGSKKSDTTAERPCLTAWTTSTKPSCEPSWLTCSRQRHFAPSGASSIANAPCTTLSPNTALTARDIAGR